MIIARYLSKQLLLATFAITTILVLVVMSSRFARYAQNAAEGRISVDVIAPAMLFALPQMLELIVPLSFFLAILVVYGHLYENSEMTVLRACGVSTHRILRITLLNALFLALVVGLFAFFVTPKSKVELTRAIAEQGMQSELGAVAPGRFYDLSRQRGTVYARGFSDNRTVMEGVFIRSLESVTEHGYILEAVISAERGHPRQGDDGGYYFVLENGKSYRGIPGLADFEVSRFASFGQRLEPPQPFESVRDPQELLTLPVLIQMPESAQKTAEVSWRFSLPVLLFVIATIAIPLSRTDARSGRFARVIPAILLYLVYLVLLNAGKGVVQESGLSPLLAIWPTHLVFLILGLVLMYGPEWRLARRRAT